MSENTWCRRELGSSLHSRLVTSSGSWTIMDTLPDSGARLRSWMKLIGLTVISSVLLAPGSWHRGTECFWGDLSSIILLHSRQPTPVMVQPLQPPVTPPRTPWSDPAQPPAHATPQGPSGTIPVNTQHSYSHSANSRDPEIRRSVQPHTAGLTLLCIWERLQNKSQFARIKGRGRDSGGGWKAGMLEMMKLQDDEREKLGLPGR